MFDAEGLNGVSIGPDPSQAGLVDSVGKGGALAEEAVTRDHSIGAFCEGHADDVCTIGVAVEVRQ